MRLLLIDGTNVVVRYAHAMVPGFADLPADHSTIVEAVPEVLGAVEHAIRECALTIGSRHVVVALDSRHSFRRAFYPDYKAHRSLSTAVWVARMTAHCAARGLLTAQSPGYEADDVVATLAARAALNGHTAAVLSSDSDLLALASPSCDVYQFGRKDEPRFAQRSPDWIAAKYDIESSARLRDYKALVGEPGDNLPGLAGIGPVKARKLLKEHGSVRGVLLSGALTPEQIVTLTMMIEMVTLRDYVPLDAINPASCRVTGDGLTIGGKR